MKNWIAALTWFAFISSFAPPSARAVNISSTGRGQVALFPFYSVRSAESILNLINTRSEIVAVKIRLLEGDPRDVTAPRSFEFIAYLGPFKKATWSLANPEFTTSPCTITSGERANFDFGSVEIFQMASLPENFNLSDCKALKSAWQVGGDFAANRILLKSPPGGLFAHLDVKDLNGSSFSIHPTMLDGFTSRPQHASAGDPHPNLSDVNPKESVVFKTESQLNQSSFVHSHWNNGNAKPTDPIAAVLSQNWLMALFDGRAIDSRSFTLALNFPLRRFENQPYCYRTAFSTFSPSGESGAQNLDASACRNATLISLPSQDVFLNLPGQLLNPKLAQGWLKVVFNRDVPRLISDELDIFTGIPVLAEGFSSQNNYKERMGLSTKITFGRDRP